MQEPPPRPTTSWHSCSRASSATASVVSTEGSGSTPAKTQVSTPASCIAPAIRSATPSLSIVSSVTTTARSTPKSAALRPTWAEQPGPKVTAPAMRIS